MIIKSIIGREIYDSRGWPTVQCDITLEDGFTCSASVPTGVSQGNYEAKKLYDGGDRLWGRGVTKAVEIIDSIIAKKFVGRKPHAIDMDLELLALDGTPNKAYLGANTLLAVSMAIYRAHAYLENTELFEFIGHICGASTVSVPFPFFNLINGGMHARNALNIQEFMVVPVGTSDFRKALEIGATVFHELGEVLQKRNKQISFGDEGGYACSFTNEIEALDCLMEALELVQQKYNFFALIALDIAASTFYDHVSKCYVWSGQLLPTEELVEIYETLIERYPICSIEDGLADNDWDGWAHMYKRIGEKIQIFGDDIFATNLERIAQGIEQKIAHGAVIKPNQIGTVTETLQAISLCQKNNFATFISHRSGDTEDSFIADLAVGVSSGHIKSGAPCRSERLVKYNRLLAIEDYLMRSM
jgi:enolase